MNLVSSVAITWEDAPEEQHPKLNLNYKVRCKVTANPAPIVDWLRNGEQIPLGPRHIVETDGLIIVNATEADDGIYTCRAVVINTGELSEKNIRVEVSVTHFGSILCVVIHCCSYMSVTCYLKSVWAAGVACHCFRNKYYFS
jgi:hypothetical protein